MSSEAPEPSREEREKADKELKEKEAAEQATLPYKWTQTIKDLDVTATVPGNIKGRDLEVVLTKTKIKVAVKGQSPIIEVHDIPCCVFAGSPLKRIAIKYLPSSY